MQQSIFEVEKTFLYGVLSYPGEIASVITSVRPEFFTTNETRELWENIVSDYNDGRQVDLSTMLARVNNRDWFINQIINPFSECTPMGVTACAITLRDNFVRNTIMANANAIVAAANAGVPIEDLSAKVATFSESVSVEDDRPSISVKEGVNKVAEILNTPKRVKIHTGFFKLDGIVNGGFKPGELVVLAARPSVGKTSVMLQMAKGASLSGYKAAVFSLEMKSTELTEKLLLSTGKLTSEELAADTFSNWPAFEEASKEIESLNVLLEDGCRTFDQICAKIVALVRQKKVNIVFIDYLTLITGGDPRTPLYQIIGSFTRRFKQLAQALGIPIVILSQLSRDVVKGGIKRAPQLSDLRESGAIEQDADIVLMLERDSYDLPDGVSEIEAQVIKMWIRKNRKGAAGEVCLRLKASNGYTVFTEMSPDEVVCEHTPEPIKPTPAPGVEAPESRDTFPDYHGEFEEPEAFPQYPYID